MKTHSLIYSQNLFRYVWNIPTEVLIKYIFIFIKDTSQKMFNAIFVKGKRVIPAGNFADDEASDEFLSIGIKDIDKLVELCDMYQCKGPNEYKLEFDVATHKFDASYRYDNYTKSGISPVSEFMSWYEEIKEKYGK